MKYAIVEDALVFMDDEYALAYAYPAGDAPAVKCALERLMQYSKDRNVPFRL